MNARCLCTMQAVRDHWTKPDVGYFDPDPHCPHCSGTGQIEVIFNPDGSKLFIAICSVCGQENGGYCQSDGMRSPIEKGIRHRCLNDDCPNGYCDWVQVESDSSSITSE